MQDTPKGNRIHIAIFGRRNVGKSSLINALTKQEIAVVSDVAGTTTDPVYKAMELLPIGPVMIIDTAGIDDEGSLGQLRVQKTIDVLNKTDVAILVLDSTAPVTAFELDLKEQIQKRKIPLIGVVNKADLGTNCSKELENQLGISLLPVSARTGDGIEQLKALLIKEVPAHFEEPFIVRDLLQPGELAVLVVPIDKAAPKGRLILPQVQTLRDILDSDAIGMVVKENELANALKTLAKKPKIVITDSQAFSKVAADTPRDILMTSFSILFARFKGDLVELVKGAKAVKHLQPGDKVLIAETCTHHRQKGDIGKDQIPRFLSRYVGGELEFTWSSGMTYPQNVEQFNLIVHCAGCMVNRREMLYRIHLAKQAGVPIVNYGILLALLNGVLDRALKPFPPAERVWELPN